MTTEGISIRKTLCALWGALGVMAVLVFAIVRMTPIALDGFREELSAVQWSVLVMNILLMAWFEGYKGFQQSFSPRVAARALYLLHNPAPVHTQLLAPFFCCGYFGANRRTILTLWIGTIAIVTAVLIMHQLDQPWRGILDAGVIVGLTWGLASLILYVIKSFATGDYYHSPGVM
jgi:hypothetical protein